MTSSIQRGDCSSCLYFDSLPDDWGLCKRFPPIAHGPLNTNLEPQEALHQQRSWPIVRVFESCGEWTIDPTKDGN